MDCAISHKQERSRTRWSASLDKIFADLVVNQIRLGNRPNNIFDKKTWNNIRDEFNKQTDLNFNNNQLRKHLDVLRTRFYNLKSNVNQNEFASEDSCCIGFELWEDIGLRPEVIKTKDYPIYEQLCTIFSESTSDGKYAQSSHYEVLHKSVGLETAGLASCPEGGIRGTENFSSSRHMQGNISSAERVTRMMAERKKCQFETHSSLGRTEKDQAINDAIAEAMLEMVAATKVRRVAREQQDNIFTITNCIKALDEIEGIDQQLYFVALDLFDDPDLRETFICLKENNVRLMWLQEKCGNSFVRD